jgi:hypothetical protein
VVALDVAVVVAVALLAVLVAGLLRSHAEIIRALHGMGVDLSPSPPASRVSTPVSLAPRPTPARPDASDVMDLAGASPTGEALSIAVRSVRHDTLIAFLTSGCHTCRNFWDAFRTGTPDVPGGARLVVVTRGAEAESPGAIAELGGRRLPVIMSTEVWEHYDIPAAPYFVYVSGPAAKVVGEGTAETWEQVRTLVSNAVADGTTNPVPASLNALRKKPRADAEREDRVDHELSGAGILPGDPRLHPNAIDDRERS